MDFKIEITVEKIEPIIKKEIEKLEKKYWNGIAALILTEDETAQILDMIDIITSEWPPADDSENKYTTLENKLRKLLLEFEKNNG